jgi:hypothetical protein
LTVALVTFFFPEKKKTRYPKVASSSLSNIGLMVFFIEQLCLVLFFFFFTQNDSTPFVAASQSHSFGSFFKKNRTPASIRCSLAEPLFLVLFLKRTERLYSLQPRRANAFGSFWKRRSFLTPILSGGRRPDPLGRLRRVWGLAKPRLLLLFTLFNKPQARKRIQLL